MTPHTLVVIAKSPVPGQVKTRLSPTFTPEEAAALAAAMTRDTLAAVAAVGPRHTVIAWEGPRTAWLPGSAAVLNQCAGPLDVRLEQVFAQALDTDDDRPTILVGMDTPQVSGPELEVDWAGADAVLGLCEDGGYWAIGFRRFHPGAIRGITMSTTGTGAEQLRRLRALGLTVRLLPTMRDVDEPVDAAHVAALVPDSRFGRLHRRLIRTPCAPTLLLDAAMSGGEVLVEVGHSPAQLRSLHVGAWLAMSAADEMLASRCEAPVLDIGCGPGRFVEALGARGIPVLGVDVSRAAVAQTAGRGVPALLRDVYDRLPGEGRWGTVLLADGNIGVGGDPLTLLRRCAELLRPGGIALVEEVHGLRRVGQIVCPLELELFNEIRMAEPDSRARDTQ